MAAHGLIGETTTDVSGHVDRRVLYLRRLFLDDLSHNWSLGEMAERVNISTSHLGRLFLSETGFPPKQFLRELRLDHAAQLLQESFLTIKQIRLSLGLNDKTMFVNAFKAKYGATPREYRLRVAGAVEYRTKPDGITGMRGNTTK